MEVSGEEVSQGKPVHVFAVAAVNHLDFFRAEPLQEAMRAPLASKSVLQLRHDHRLATSPPLLEKMQSGPAVGCGLACVLQAEALTAKVGWWVGR